MRIVPFEGPTIEKSVNNYFSIGFGAKIAHDFGVWRDKNQALFSSRAINKAAYAFDGIVDSVVRSCKNLERKIKITVGLPILPFPSLLKKIHKISVLVSWMAKFSPCQCARRSSS